MDDRDAYKEHRRKLEAEVNKRYKALREEVDGRISLLELPEGVTIKKRHLGYYEWEAYREDIRLVQFIVYVERVQNNNPIIRIRKVRGHHIATRSYARLKSGGWNVDKAIETFTQYVAESNDDVNKDVELHIAAKEWSKAMREVFGELGAMVNDSYSRRYDSKFRVDLVAAGSILPSIRISDASEGKVRAQIGIPPRSPEETKRIIEAVIEAMKAT